MTSSLPNDADTPDFSSDDASLDRDSMARRLAGVVAPSGHPHARAMLRASILGGVGPSIGRYSVRRVLGSGGMGVVFEAHDPVLDRLVAIKLMHSQRNSPAARARLAAEARAIAALSHPHVVAVYEVGEHDGELFVVMEHVAGTTLADWLALERRSVDEILDTMLQAGEALVAVHAIGLVHCDFKPQNVLVGADGRTRVADFGIAPAGHAWAGTAAYMAPEQRDRDAPPDAKGDQYAFCLVLHEALGTRRPVAARDGDERSVPRRLARIVAKGRHEDPHARHPSMAVLVAELRDVRARPRRVRAWTAGVLAAAAVVALATAREEVVAPDPWCGPDDPVRRAWNSETRAQLDQVFASAAPAIRDSWDRHAPRLDGAARAIADMRAQACSSTDEQARACLRRRVAALEATIAALRSADDAALNDVAMLVAGVPTGPCSSDDVAVSLDARTDAVVAAIERARMFGLAVQMEGARAAVSEALALATELDDRSLLSEALLVNGEYLVAVGEFERGAATLRDAAWLAEAARNDGIAADAWNDLAFHEAYVEHDVEAARASARLAEATCERIGCSGARLARLWNTLGVVEQYSGNLDAAIDRFQHALAAASEVSPDSSRVVIDPLGNLAVAYNFAGREAEALPLFERALAAQQELLRPDHPEIAVMLGNTSGTLRELGLADEALALDRRVLAILERAYGSEHIDVAKAHMNLAMSLRPTGALDEALAHVQQALAIFERLLGAQHPDVVHAYTLLGRVLDDRHDEAGAIRAYERAVELAAAVDDAVQEYTARARFGLMLWRRRELERAHEQLSRAMQAHERGHLRLFPLTVRVLDALANLEIGMGRLDDARARIALADTVPLATDADAEVISEHAAVRERLAATRPR